MADKRRKRPILVGADIARAALMATVPVAHVLDLLTIELLYAVSFGLATVTMLFQIGYRSLLPSVVERSQLTEANSKLEFATSSAGVGGPAGVGLLVQLVTAPFALIAGSVLYLLSAVFFITINSEEPDLRQESANGGGVREGLEYFWRQKPLVGIAAASFLFSVFGTAINALAGLYMINVLGINPATLGAMITIGGSGLFLGAFLVSRYASKIGVGRAMTFGLFAVGVGELTIPLASGPLPVVVATIVVGAIVIQTGIVPYNVGGVSIRQSIAPDRLQARLTSISVVVGAAGVPIGGLAGGFLGEVIGLRETLFVSSVGMLSATICLFFFRTWPIRLTEPEPA